MAKSILIADDSATIRKVVELTFSDGDYHVEAAASGAEALERLHRLRLDFVLADVVMPEPTGYAICRKVKQSARPVPVLLLAGAFEAFDPELARACGADGYLTKPFDSRLLRERVEELLAAAGRTALPQAVEPDVRPASPIPAGLSPQELDALVRAVVQRISVDVLRELAREVLPAIAERVVRERIRELEQQD